MAAVTEPLAAGSVTAAAASGPRGMQASRRRRLNLFRYVVFTLFGLFFLVPLLAMVRFSLRGHQARHAGRWRPGRRSCPTPGLLAAPSRSPWSWPSSPAW